MISAAEAYKTSVLNNSEDRQIEEVDTCIRNAAMNGVYSCVYPGLVTELVKKQLKDNDYDFQIKFSGGTWFTLISWDIW